jgi:hypothetical protein
MRPAERKPDVAAVGEFAVAGIEETLAPGAKVTMVASDGFLKKCSLSE